MNISANEALVRMIRASVDAARERCVEASSEADLRLAAKAALSILMRAGTDNLEDPTPATFLNSIGALGAYLYLEAFSECFPNVEAMLLRIDHGDRIIYDSIRKAYAASQASRSSRAEKDQLSPKSGGTG